MGYYATVAQLRAEPEVPDAAPPDDATLEALIAQASDQIDEWIGARPIVETGGAAGRKIDQAVVIGWQWTKLQRAVVRLAARLYADPGILTGPQWGSVSGPDFSKSSPAPTRRRIADVIAPLNASGLRVTGGRAAP